MKDINTVQELIKAHYGTETEFRAAVNNIIAAEKEAGEEETANRINTSFNYHLQQNKASPGTYFSPVTIIAILGIVFVLATALYSIWNYNPENMITKVHKPAIYLYPTTPQDITVKLQFDGTLTHTIPEYDKAWNVKAFPDGQIQIADGQEYPYLFWEGNTDALRPDFKKGFLVRNGDTETFLNDKLTKLGLSQTEISDFIEYWGPRMKQNPYNLVYFAGREYTDIAGLYINPEPDSILRVFMVYKAVPGPVEIEGQTLKPFERKGFTVIEWGGAEIPEVGSRTTYSDIDSLIIGCFFVENGSC